MSAPTYLAEELYSALVDQRVAAASIHHPDPRSWVMEELGKEGVWPVSIRDEAERAAS